MARQKKTSSAQKRSRGARTPPVRYAVVGLGHIAQKAALPAFRSADGAQLAALVSGTGSKLKKLGKQYKVKAHYDYADLEKCIKDEGIEAVYIATPNSLHRDLVIRAANAGAHVLCEKPLGVSVEECEEMIEAAESNGVHLMTAYRLHFEEANLEAVRLVKSGRIGAPMLFSSEFGFEIKKQNIRLQEELGGGALFDLGIYCINAARYLFRAEPVEVWGEQIQGQDERFQGVDGTTAATLRFPQGQIAQFSCSFTTAPVSTYRILGTKGSITLDPAFEYETALSMEVSINEKRRSKRFRKGDQFAAEIAYFAECIRKNRSPEPSGREGLADIRIIEAIRESARSGTRIALTPFEKDKRPQPQQARHEPPPPDSVPEYGVESPAL